MTYSSYCESADFLRTRLNGFTPEALLILGSGLGFLGDAVEDPIFVDYGEVPHFRPSTAPGHKGRFVFGTLRGRRVAVMQGRMHCYEGYTMAEAAYVVRVVRLLGAKTLFVTNAAGCVNTDWNVGELMLLSDHIKLFDFGPLYGPNLEEFGTRFPICPPSTPRACAFSPMKRQRRTTFLCVRAFICISPARSLKRPPKSAPRACSAPTRSVCPPCPRPSSPPTAAWRSWA